MYAHFYDRRLPATEIIAHYQAGEPQAVAHVDRFMDVLAICLGNLLTVLDPHLVVIGGGLSNFDAIYQALPQRLPAHLLRVLAAAHREGALWRRRRRARRGVPQFGSPNVMGVEARRECMQPTTPQCPVRRVNREK